MADAPGLTPAQQARVVAVLSPQWATLTPSARLLLLTLATHADDSGVYDAGHLLLAIALTGRVSSPASRQRVHRGIRELLAAGALERWRGATWGNTAVYQVTVTSWASG